MSAECEEQEDGSDIEVCFDGTLYCPKSDAKIYSEDCVGCDCYRGRIGDVDCFIVSCVYYDEEEIEDEDE